MRPDTKDRTKTRPGSHSRSQSTQNSISGPGSGSNNSSSQNPHDTLKAKNPDTFYKVDHKTEMNRKFGDPARTHVEGLVEESGNYSMGKKQNTPRSK